jgi:hypothetical protein
MKIESSAFSLFWVNKMKDIAVFRQGDFIFIFMPLKLSVFYDTQKMMRFFALAGTRPSI